MKRQSALQINTSRDNWTWRVSANAITLVNIRAWQHALSRYNRAWHGSANANTLENN